MLTNAILITLAGALNGLIGLLPLAQQLPTEINTAMQFVADKFSEWVSLFPFLGTLITVILLIITIEGFIFLYGSVNWTINKLRGSG